MGNHPDPDKAHYYDVDRFKELVERSQSSVPPAKGLKLLLARFASSVDSCSGMFATFGGIMIVLAGPLIVVIGALYGLVGFLVTFLGLIAALGFYVERKLGASIQVGDYNIGLRLLAQIVGFCAVAGIFLFAALVLPMLGLRVP